MWLEIIMWLYILLINSSLKKVTLMNNIISCMNVMCVMRVSIIYVIKYFINEAVVYIHHVYLP